MEDTDPLENLHPRVRLDGYIVRDVVGSNMVTPYDWAGLLGERPRYIFSSHSRGYRNRFQLTSDGRLVLLSCDYDSVPQPPGSVPMVQPQSTPVNRALEGNFYLELRPVPRRRLNLFVPFVGGQIVENRWRWRRLAPLRLVVGPVWCMAVLLELMPAIFQKSRLDARARRVLHRWAASRVPDGDPRLNRAVTVAGSVLDLLACSVIGTPGRPSDPVLSTLTGRTVRDAAARMFEARTTAQERSDPTCAAALTTVEVSLALHCFLPLQFDHDDYLRNPFDPTRLDATLLTNAMWDCITAMVFQCIRADENLALPPPGALSRTRTSISRFIIKRLRALSGSSPPRQEMSAQESLSGYVNSQLSQLLWEIRKGQSQEPGKAVLTHMPSEVARLATLLIARAGRL